MKNAWNVLKLIGIAAVIAVSTTACKGPAPDSLMPMAAAAEPSMPMHSPTQWNADAGDSRSDNYRLERDSCCVGN